MPFDNLRYALRYNFARSAAGPATAEQIDSFLGSLITDHDGLGIGEYHGAYAYPAFVANRAKFLASLGVSQFVAEIIPRAQQQRINRWQDDGDPQPFIDFLNARKTANSSYQFQRYWEMFNALHAAGIRIHAAAMTADAQNRFSMSRANAEIMETVKSARARLEQGQKFIVYGGRAHFRICDGVPGVSEQLGIPALHLDEGRYGLSCGVLSPAEHIALIPRAEDQVAYFRGPVTKHRPIAYPA